MILLEHLKHDPSPPVGVRNLMKTHPTEWACSFVPQKVIICLQKFITFLCSLEFMHNLQGPLSALRSGTAMELRRRSPSVRITHEGWKYIPFVKGGLGSSPKKIFWYNMAEKAILIHFEVILSCESKLILQALSYILYIHMNLGSQQPDKRA